MRKEEGEEEKPKKEREREGYKKTAKITFSFCLFVYLSLMNYSFVY
jgi:hypothetical protein